jgi:preprotein translocase SecE subunit
LAGVLVLGASVNGKPAVSKTATEGSIPSAPGSGFCAVRTMNKIVSFLKEVYVELTKVTWLARKDVVRSTIAVSFVVILVAIYVNVIDMGLNIFIKSIIGGR